VLYQAGNVTQATQAAIDDATRNGFTNGANNTTVTVNGSTMASTYAPTSGPYAGESPVLHVEVIIVRQVKTTLVPAEAAFNPVRARGVAGSTPVATANAITVLDPSANQALSSSSSGTIHATGGNIFVDSSSSSSISTSGSGSITAASPYTIGTVGGTAGNNYSPAVSTNQTLQPDPDGGWPRPSTTGMTNYGNCCSNGTTTVQPGIYDQFNYSGNTDITMAAGTYIVRHGISISGSGSIVGTGVFIFSTNQNYPTSGTNCGDVAMSSGGGFQLTAPTTGAYTGMVIYVDRNCNNAQVALSGGGSATLTGTIYAPKGIVKMSGSSDLTINSAIIADKVQITGSGSLTVNFNAAQNAAPTIPALVE